MVQQISDNTNGTNDLFTRRPLSVCVIGAGAAGLCALRHFTAHNNRFGPIVCYEQTDRVGGTWNYTDEVGTDRNGLPIYSSMYRDMRTNLPMEIMVFPDFDWTHQEHSYVSHTEVLQYLNDYADHFQLRQYIQFEHYLTHVTRDGLNFTSAWKVTVRQLSTNQTFTHSFDVLILCPGRYCSPIWPQIDSIGAFAGSIVHSHDYRSNESYVDKRAAVVGGGPSGIDICLEVASVATEVILINRKEPFKDLPENVRQIKGEITQFGAHSMKVKLQENEEEDFQLDSIILATGYRFNLDYLDQKSAGIRLRPDQTLDGLYRHYINIEQPTMAIISVLQRILPFPLFHQQIQYFMKTLLGDQVHLPSRQQMLREVEADFAKRKALGFRDQDRHLANVDLYEQYLENITRDGQLQPIAPVTLSLYRYLGKVRQQNIVGYKDRNYRVIDGERFEEIV